VNIVDVLNYVLLRLFCFEITKATLSVFEIKTNQHSS